MNNSYIAHIVRDIFPIHSACMYYGIDKSFVDTLNTSEHGIGSINFYSSQETVSNLENFTCWNIENSRLHVGDNFFDLFISIQYDPDIDNDSCVVIGSEIKRVLKKNALLLVINCDKISKCFENIFAKRKDIIKEVKRYSILKNENVLVYENI